MSINFPINPPPGTVFTASNSIVYTYSGSYWEATALLSGPQGDMGPDGPSGPSGPSGPTGTLNGTISNIDITDTTDSNSTDTGALIVSGGVGIAKDLWTGGTIHAPGLEITSPRYEGNGNISYPDAGTYVLGNLRFFTSDYGDVYIHVVLPSRYNIGDGTPEAGNSRMFCLEIKGYAYGIPSIINMMISGYVTPPYNGGPMENVTAWDATGLYSPTAYYSDNLNVGVVRFYLSEKYYTTFTINSIAVGNGDIIEPGELTIVQSADLTI
jgi:hypothetical protein